MMKDHKAPWQIKAEQEEARQLAQQIVAFSNRIPDRILNHGSHGDAVAYKRDMMAALKVTTHRPLNLDKLRSAYNLVSGYYRAKESA
jgi:hypothetical protein